MNIILTLLIYNPLEAYFLIKFCDIFTKRKFILSDIKYCYIMGGINYIIQSIPNIFYGTNYFMILQIFVIMLLLPVISWILYSYLITYINFNKTLFAYMLLFITVVIVCFVILPIFTKTVCFYNMPLNIEFICNISLVCAREFILYIFKRGIYHYEKID